MLVLKAEGTQAELQQQKAEAAQGAEQLKSAMARRGFAQRAAAARTGDPALVRPDRLRRRPAFDRMAEKMEGRSDLDDARRQVEEALDPMAGAPERDFVAERELREARADAMLEELKRRMSKGE